MGDRFPRRRHHAIPVMEADASARPRPHDRFADESACVVGLVVVETPQSADHQADITQAVDGDVEHEGLVVDGVQGLFLDRGFGFFDLSSAKHEGDLHVWVCGTWRREKTKFRDGRK